eukprot:CAMPEP_0119315462 /NCGR_PEP_ID=MMETSP1333-20130426/35967_1 /TAXON_ID=418940 /ORGANISM="Scyphosphaera apsteinii, Strain RCC1455" /LENGTH=236 /DNA_ID=CAMNT_0007320829 /DNA_START=18 /DNA_END=725 /DNA_ORIENTATION=+
MSLMGERSRVPAATMPLPTSTQHMKISNKQTALREMQRAHILHVDKLRKMKASVDMTRPQQYPHVACNAKRMQMESERNFAIERENKILLGKMYTIMNSEIDYNKPMKPPLQVSTLNMTVRKQEYDRIARENQAIMQRILQREPNHNRLWIEEDWKVTKRYLRDISEYPFMLGSSLPPATRKRMLRPLDSGEIGESDRRPLSEPASSYGAPELAYSDPTPAPAYCAPAPVYSEPVP